MKKGESVFVIESGNLARNKSSEALKRGTAIIEKAGNKYFHVKFYPYGKDSYCVDISFCQDSMKQKSNYTADYECYLSETDYNNSVFLKRAKIHIREYAQALTYEQASKIMEILHA